MWTSIFDLGKIYASILNLLFTTFNDQKKVVLEFQINFWDIFLEAPTCNFLATANPIDKHDYLMS